MEDQNGRIKNRNTYTANENSNNFKSFSNLVNSFCSHKDELKSAGWDEYRKIIDNFQGSIRNIGLYSNDLSDCLSALQNDISTCMDGYAGNLKFPGKFGSDPEKALSAIKDEINTCKKNISVLESQLYKEVTILGIKIKKLDENVKSKLEEARKYLEDLNIFIELVSNLLTIKKKYYNRFAQILSLINSIHFS